MFDGADQVLLVPVPGREPERLDLGEIYRAERRIAEIQNANEHTAPNLLSCFNAAYLDASALLKRLEVHLGEAERASRARRSVVILDLVPETLKLRGLASARSPAGSEDLRTAVLDADADYAAALARVDQIRAMAGLLGDKRRGFEMAYGAVKALVKTDYRPFASNSNLSAAPIDAPQPAGYAARPSPSFGGSRDI